MTSLKGARTGWLMLGDVLLLLQRTRARFPNLVFRVSAHDHTECDAAGNMREPVTQCVPAGQGARCRTPQTAGIRICVPVHGENIRISMYAMLHMACAIKLPFAAFAAGRYPLHIGQRVMESAVNILGRQA